MRNLNTIYMIIDTIIYVLVGMIGGIIGARYSEQIIGFIGALCEKI